jgi:hypothetical protein
VLWCRTDSSRFFQNALYVMLNTFSISARFFEDYTTRIECEFGRLHISICLVPLCNSSHSLAINRGKTYLFSHLRHKPRTAGEPTGPFEAYCGPAPIMSLLTVPFMG